MPRPVVRDEDDEEVRTKKVEEKVRRMEEQYSSLVLTQIEKTGTPEVGGLTFLYFVFYLVPLVFCALSFITLKSGILLALE